MPLMPRSKTSKLGVKCAAVPRSPKGMSPPLPIAASLAGLISTAVAASAAGGCGSARLADITLEAAGYAPDRELLVPC
jgi:hypothetical protein